MQQVTNLVDNYSTLVKSPYELVYGCVLVLLIVYSSVIPLFYKQFADSILGRILGVGCIYVTIHYMGWVYGLLTAMAFLLLLNGASRMIEGFDGGGTVSEKKTINKKWFVESLLGEKPKKIAIDRITTSAIED
jgi:hypothetical protein